MELLRVVRVQPSLLNALAVTADLRPWPCGGRTLAAPASSCCEFRTVLRQRCNARVSRRTVLPTKAPNPAAHQLEEVMAAMCPIDGCKAKKGLCIHDKLMIVMGVMLIVGAGGHWVLHLF